MPNICSILSLHCQVRRARASVIAAKQNKAQTNEIVDIRAKQTESDENLRGVVSSLSCTYVKIPESFDKAGAIVAGVQLVLLSATLACASFFMWLYSKIGALL